MTLQQQGKALPIRPFGWATSDLNIDFRLARPQIVTRILCACLENTTAEDMLRLTVSRRTEYLLRITSLSTGRDLTYALRCIACGQRIEVDFSVDELVAVQREAEGRGAEDGIPVELEGRTLMLRVPTGYDQMRWQRIGFTDARHMVEEMARMLLYDPASPDPASTLDEAAIKQLNQVLQDFDPLVNFSFAANCPSCGEVGQYEVDLQGAALEALHAMQTRVLEDVHQLALNYHWHEDSIMALPVWRRQHYLSLIERERSR